MEIAGDGEGVEKFALGVGHQETSMKLTDEQLLAELEDAIRSIPALGNLMGGDLDTAPWLGRTAAILEKTDPMYAIKFASAQSILLSGIQGSYPRAALQFLAVLHEARTNLLLRIPGPRSVAIAGGGVFSYFDEVSKIVQTAKNELLFVDPYLDRDFVSRFLEPLSSPVSVRLLSSDNKYLATLVTAVKLLIQQKSISVNVRTTDRIHDRYVLVDGLTCYQSGASFKDGARNAPVTITQIVDAFPAVKDTYEALWKSANPII